MYANNMFCVSGRIARDPKVYENRDGSHKVCMTIAAQNPYREEDGSRGAQFIQVEAFVPAGANGLGVYGYIRKGEMVAVSGSVRTSIYPDKETGESVFKQTLNANMVTLLESKSTGTRGNGRTSGHKAKA